MQSKEIQLCPISGWDIALIQTYGQIMMRLDYLVHATQLPSEALQTPHLAMTKSQALELSDALKRAAEHLGNDELQGAGLPRH